MKHTVKQYAEALHDTLNSTAPKDIDTVLDNFVKVLAASNDLKLFPEIEEELHRLDLKAKGKTLAHVTSASTLSPESEKNIVNQLNDLIKGKVELKKKIDKDLVGGVVIQMEDTLIDASVKKSLQDLKTNLEE